MREPCKPNIEQLDLPEIGECFCRGPSLTERVNLSKMIDGSDPDHVPVLGLIAAMVIDAEGAAIWDVENWDIWTGKNDAAAADLITIVLRMAGLGGEEAKKP
jgi:hypothetical protein